MSSLLLQTLPKGQLALLAIAGSLMILSSFYLLQQGQIMPLAAVIVVTFMGWLMFKRIVPSVVSRPPPDPDASAFTVFRDLEPADQTRVNVWTGFLQEDVYKNRTGPIGDFVGNDDVSKKAPLYSFGGDIVNSGTSANVPSCQLLERDLSKFSQSYVDSLVAKCQADLMVLAPDSGGKVSIVTGKNCPGCTCLPIGPDPKKTTCGRMENGVFLKCPADCCVPSCFY
jgi:hypothetical protein